jgi:hypothetical protein
MSNSVLLLLLLLLQVARLHDVSVPFTLACEMLVLSTVVSMLTELLTTMCALRVTSSAIAGGADKPKWYAHVKGSKAWSDTVRISGQAAISLKSKRKGSNINLALSKLKIESLQVISNTAIRHTHCARAKC